MDGNQVFINEFFSRQRVLLDTSFNLKQAYTGLDASLSFDVLVLSGKSQWTSISRWPNAASAQNEARKLVATKKHLGVKVAQETYDEAENRFKEKTLFKHMKSEQKPAPAAGASAGAASASAASEFGAFNEFDGTDEYDEFDDFDDYDDETDWVVPVFGVFTALAVVLGLGIFLFDGKIDVGQSVKSDYYIYELPSVVANLTDGEEMVSVRIDLQLELDNTEDAKEVEFAIAQIMESVVVEIQETNPGDLQRSEKIQLLRAQLKQKIQDAIGETNLNGVLFKNIKVF